MIVYILLMRTATFNNRLVQGGIWLADSPGGDLFVLFVFYKYPYYPKNVKYPKLKTIKKYLRKVIGA